ncbi:hypothetical protein BC940DRAFT_295974 [Gongronella butleri]|nr:hypothetical protein BC940DRAFT_295974 [Gongronella butleri]
MSLLLVQIAAGPLDSSSNSHQKDKVQRIPIVFIDFRCFRSVLRGVERPYARMALRKKNRTKDVRQQHDACPRLQKKRLSVVFVHFQCICSVLRGVMLACARMAIREIKKEDKARQQDAPRYQKKTGNTSGFCPFPVLFQSVEWCRACMFSHARMAMKGKKE